MSANDRQVGGDHYRKTDGEQHWDRIYRLFGPGYFVGCGTKYLERYKNKGGRQDLEKSIHYIEKLIELEYGATPTTQPPPGFRFVGSNPVDVTPVVPKETTIEVARRSYEQGRQDASTINAMTYDFPADIERFNKMYFLATPKTPRLYEDGGPAARLKQFKKILLDEIDEVDEIITKLESETATQLDILTDVADWLGDIQVYAASEMCRWGIPWAGTLKCIMHAQWTKLGEDGMPIVRDGKVIKGPKYVAPEPMIHQMLHMCMTIGYATGAVSEPTPGKTKVFTGGAPVEVTLRGPITPEQQEIHEDVDWQCEGYYGDQTQLYRHRKLRTLVRATSLAEAKAAHALWRGEPTQAATPAQAKPV